MNPEVWGPHAWFLLHSITFNYPENPSTIDKNNIRNFFYSFAEVIPCNTCKNHFKKNLKKYPLTDEVLKSNENLVTWLIDIHNIVNKDNDKNVLTREEVMEYYKNKYENYNNNNNINNNNNSNKNTEKKNKNKNKNKNKSNFNYLLFIFITIILLYIYRKKIFNLNI